MASHRCETLTKIFSHKQKRSCILKVPSFKMTEIIRRKLPLKAVRGFFSFRNIIKQSIFLPVFCHSSQKLCTDAWLPVSRHIKLIFAGGYICRILSGVLFPLNSFLDARMTAASAFANARAVSYPIPPVEPVTMTTFPTYEEIAFTFHCLSLINYCYRVECADQGYPWAWDFQQRQSEFISRRQNNFYR